MTDGAVLSYGDGELDLPRIPASDGGDGLGISDLLSTTGKVALDVGFVNTASCESAITYIDGGEGILLHRGYSIEELSEQSSFMETSYLLLNGELPNKEELDTFTYTITRHTMVNEQLNQLYKFGNALRTANLVKHVERGLIGAAMSRAPQAGNAGCDTGKRIGTRRTGKANGRS